MQPGQTITPGSPVEPDSSDTPLQTEVTTPAVPVSSPSEATTNPEPTYSQEASSLPSVDQQTDSEALATWTASEYIAHDKGLGWFVLLGIGLFVIIGLIYLVTKDIFASVLVGIAGITFGVFSVRPPRILKYEIHPQGIVIGDKSYSFNEFKSFAINDDGPIPSVLLMPLKRFLPPITVFFDPKEGDSIIDALANYLPHELREPDMVDRLMSRIRF